MAAAMAGYSRGNPSPRYRELTEAYRQLHVEGERFLNLSIAPANTFPGLSLPLQAKRVKRLVTATGAASILDYGSGKGQQYDPREFRAEDGQVYDSIQDYWGVDFVQCYDPGFEPFSVLPSRRFDGVICTDVLEHCAEDDLPWIVDEMFGLAGHFVFASVACYPARKRLPSGENAHCTVRPAVWWRDLFAGAAQRHPTIDWEAWAQSHEETPAGVQRIDRRLARGGG
ncbi:MAG: class I SAM-dependent methyltransferase [Longimicrobiales bacterium]